MLESRLAGARFAVDVQHLYRANHPGDRGAKYRLADGTSVFEASAATLYAQALTGWLRSRGAEVLTNDPVKGILVGIYPRRQREALAWGADAYLACHLNAGGGAYGALELLASDVSRSRPLAQRIAAELTAAIAVPCRTVDLALGVRGTVCIEVFAVQRPALILEPFFGDYPPHQKLLSAPNLSLVGEAIGRGLADWWQFSGRA